MNIADILTEKYLSQAIKSGKRSRDIARETRINDRTIRWYFRKYNLVVPKWKPHKVWNKGLGIEDERINYSIKKANKARRGKPPWNKGRKLKPFTKEHREKISNKLWGVYVGKKNSHWKGGISGDNKRIRMSSAFKKWREKVFVRDNYTCQNCGIRGGVLHPHHIKSFSGYPELRFDTPNGETLCRKCHNFQHGKVSPDKACRKTGIRVALRDMR